MPAQKTAADHLAALQALLPTGPVWPRDSGSTLAAVCRGVAILVARVQARADALLVDSFPATTAELLPEWERSLGLPDTCVGDDPSTQQRRARVLARLTARGGQSVPYFTAQAAALGFTVDVQEFAVARAGLTRVGERLNGEAWAHTFRIRAPAQTVTFAQSGLAKVGDPLASWGNQVLTCTLARLAPAHTVIQFGYGS